jgi:hypothetical protein
MGRRCSFFFVAGRLGPPTVLLESMSENAILPSAVTETTMMTTTTTSRLRRGHSTVPSDNQPREEVAYQINAVCCNHSAH